MTPDMRIIELHRNELENQSTSLIPMKGPTIRSIVKGYDAFSFAKSQSCRLCDEAGYLSGGCCFWRDARIGTLQFVIEFQLVITHLSNGGKYTLKNIWGLLRSRDGASFTTKISLRAYPHQGEH